MNHFDAEKLQNAEISDFMVKDTGFYNLKIAKKVEETADAVTIYFEIPAELRSKFVFRAGQYLTLRVVLDDKEQRRSYSFCTIPGNDHPAITVKKVKGGKVSKYLCDTLTAGDEIEVMPPEGRFTVTPDADRKATYYMFGAGSGITPLMSQIRSILEHEPLSTIHLLYSNKSEDTIIFHQELNDLISRFEGQLTVDHTLTQEGKSGLLGGLFGKKKQTSWAGLTGRIDGRKVREFIEKYPNRLTEARYHICGPGNMIEVVKNALVNSGVDGGKIHTEYFTPPDELASGKSRGKTSNTTRATVTLRGETIELAIGEKSILETLEDAGYNPPYSCTCGACATCMAKLVKGNVTMAMCFALTEQKVEDGYILTCQSHPTTDELEITYDV